MKKLFFLLSVLTGLNLAGQTTFTMVSTLDFATSATAVSGLDATGVASAIDRVTGHVYQVGWVAVSGQKDLYVVEFDSTGAQVNVAQYDYSGNSDKGLSICVTSSSVFVCGSSEATSGNADVIIIAYDLNLNQQWAQRIAGSAGTNDQGNSIATDGSSVFVGGYVTQTGKGKDYALFKLNISSGAILAQTKKNGNNLDDICEKIVVSGSNLYCTGSFHQATSNNDVLTMCVATASMTVTWSVTANGTATGGNDTGKDIKLDGSNVIICGSLNNSGTSDDYYFAVLTASTGAVTFSNTADAYGASDVANSLVCDKIGDYAITGNAMSGSLVVIWTQGFTASSFLWNNFQPTNGTFSTSAPKVNCDTIAKYFYTCYTYSNSVTGNLDAYLSQIDPSGVKKWQKLYDGGNGKDIHTDMVLDGYARIYLSTMAETTTPNVYFIKCLRYSQTPMYWPPDFTGDSSSLAYEYYPNLGQLRDYSVAAVPQIKYYTPSYNPKIYIEPTKNYFVYAHGDTIASTTDTVERVTLDFYNSNTLTDIYQMQNTPGYTNFFLNYLDSALTGVKANKRLFVPNIWPGIDLHYYSTQDGIKYYLVAKQGICDLEDIKFNFSGQKSDTIINHELKLDCYMKNLTFNRPVVYQIDTSLTILTSGTGNWDKVGTGLYTIDSLTNVVPLWPIVIELQTNKTIHSTSTIGGLLWSTFFQNGYSDEIRVNQNNGTQYVAGYTADTHFPTYNGLYNPVAANHQDAFVATFLKNDSQYWATIYGGASSDINDSRDYATGVDYDSLGYIYVSGYTYNDTIPTWKSSNPSAYWQPKKKYPLAPGSALPDIFVLKLDSTGNRGQGHPEWCTMLGGYYGESASDLKYYHNRIYIVGSGGQSDYGTPAYSTPLKVETGAYNQDSIGGALIYKLSKDGVMDWGTYFSKLNGTCFIAACDIDKDGGLNITGATKKNGIPITVAGPNLPFGAGSSSTVPFDAYVAMFDANDAQTYCTYIGGGSWDEGYDIACTGRDTYIVGYTQSSGTYHFPFAYSSGNYIDSTLAGSQDGFICEISHANGLFEYSSLYGGVDDDEVDAVCADSRGNIDILGTTASPSIYVPASFPPTMFSESYQGSTGNTDAFVGNMANNIFTWLTYFGGTKNDGGKSICAYHDTTISFTGFGALLNNFPVTNLVVCPPCNYYDPNGSIFITKLGIQPIYIGIKELGSSKITNDVLVYPNPALTSVNVRMKDVEKNCKLEIYNAVGQTVYASVMTENTIEINTAHFTDGIYFIKIINGDKIYSGKFVKQ